MNKLDKARIELHEASVALGLAEEVYLKAYGWIKSADTGNWFHQEGVGNLKPGVQVPREYAVDLQEAHDLREEVLDADLSDPKYPDA